MGERQKLTKTTLGITAGLPLQASEGDIEALRGDIQRLMDIEAIKQLKHAYFRCVDTANLEELGTLFHEDVTVHFKGGTYEWKCRAGRNTSTISACPSAVRRSDTTTPTSPRSRC